MFLRNTKAKPQNDIVLEINERKVTAHSDYSISSSEKYLTLIKCFMDSLGIGTAIGFGLAGTLPFGKRKMKPMLLSFRPLLRCLSHCCGLKN